MLVLSACTLASGAEPVAKDPSTSTTPRPATTTTTTTTAVVPASTTTLPPDSEGEVVGLITPTGVTVAVRSRTTAGFIVSDNCGEAAYLTEGVPIRSPVVVLDPGHGGPIDTGAVGRNGLQEKEINLRVALATEELLRERGIPTILTRTADYPVPLLNRVAFADHLRPEIMVSIHHNAPTPGQSEDPGTEVFVQSGSPESRRLGGVLWEYVTRRLAVFPVAWTAAPDSGVLRVLHPSGGDAYGMIRGPETVTALVEMAYISHPEEAELLDSEEYLDVASRALADAIETYLTTTVPGSGYVEDPRVFRPQPGLRARDCEPVPLS